MTRRLAEILKDCERRGVCLSADGSRLEVRGKLPADLREELRRNKPNLLHYLRTDNCHHELEPGKCAVCSGRARKMLEEEAHG